MNPKEKNPLDHAPGDRPTPADEYVPDDFDEVMERAKNNEVRRKLNTGVCPQCEDSKLTRRIDPRQAGSRGGQKGVWVNYRCPCGFARDYVEEVESTKGPV